MIPAGSVLRRDQAVLVIVDVQERLAAVMERRERVIGQAELLIRTASIVGVPIVATRQYPKGLGDFSERIAVELNEAEASGASVSYVDKLSFDCFAEPTFSEVACATARPQLVLLGMESHICVCQTALSGLREAYDVHVVADACCSREEEAHTLAVKRLGHAGAVITTAESAAYELVGRAGTPEFKALLCAVKGEVPPAR